MPRQKQFSTDVKGSNLQCMIMGTRNVGKTTIIQRIHEIIKQDRGQSDSDASNEHDIPDEQSDLLPVPIQFSEASQFSFTSLTRVAFSTSDAFILTYAVDDKASFDYVTNLLGEIIAIRGTNTPLVVVANKIDVETRHVHPVIADCVVTIDFECKHREVNAMSGDGVKDVLSCLLGFFVNFDDPSAGNGNCKKKNLKDRFFSMFRK